MDYKEFRKKRDGTIQDAILKKLEEKPHTAQELQKLLSDVHYNSVWKSLSLLKKSGQICSRRAGRHNYYALAEKVNQNSTS